ncbi:MAG: biotin/lipoyl-binding protein [Pseudomonadota bacterium]
MITLDSQLPTLRNDIQLNEAPSESDGAPTWTLYDPAANKFYKIGWLEFECLSRFQKSKTIKKLIRDIEKETTLSADLDFIDNLLSFLMKNSLLVVSNDEALDYFEQQNEQSKQPWWKKFLFGYLFFSIPLFKPQKFLQATYPFISPLFSKPFITMVFLTLGYGIFLSIQRADEMAATFMNYLNIEGIILFISATIIVKIFHELGHAYTATKYGVNVNTIGVAFIVFYPILFTETTDAWKLKNRNQRLTIAGAGLLTEFTLAAIALLLWHSLEPGIFQSLCFMIGTVSLFASLFINLNPLMKFDGYYLFSDFTQTDNLQDRSFAFSKWHLRKTLFGWKDETPEIANKEFQKFLITFGYAVWIYRFFLYLGIGIIVYNLFFQPLGLILTTIQLIFFIGFPIIKEIVVWAQRALEIIGSIKGLITLSLLTAIIALLFIPIPQTIQIPAMVHDSEYAKIFAPIPVKIEKINISQGQFVEEGDILFELSSRNLNHNIEISQKRLESLYKIQESSQATPELARKRVMMSSEIDIAEKELEGFLKIKDQLRVRAPFSGRVQKLNPHIKVGQHVKTSLELSTISNDENKILSGYIREKDIEKVTDLKDGKFYPEYAPFKDFEVTLNSVDETSSPELYWQEISSQQGGAIPAEINRDGIARPLPRFTVYSTQFQFKDQKNVNNLPPFITRGTINIESEKQSIANKLKNNIISAFIREGYI